MSCPAKLPLAPTTSSSEPRAAPSRAGTFSSAPLSPYFRGVMLRPFGKQQHILPEQQGMRKERGANFPIPFFLFWVLFLAEGDASIKPHPGHIYCVQIADRLAVRVAGFDQAEAGRVQVVPKIGECDRSEEHTSELQSPMYLVCRLLLEKKKE